MEQSSQRFSVTIEYLFYALAIVGLVGTQLQITRMPFSGFLNGTRQFWLDVVSRPASLFLTVDILVLSAVVFLWMFSEARRLRIRFVWIYFLGGLLVGISFFVPLFMGVRQRQIRKAGAEPDAPLAPLDWLGVGLAVAAALAAAVYSVTTVLQA